MESKINKFLFAKKKKKNYNGERKNFILLLCQMKILYVLVIIISFITIMPAVSLAETDCAGIQLNTDVPFIGSCLKIGDS